MEGVTRLWLSTLPQDPPLQPTHSLIHATRDITKGVKKVAQNPAVL